jgi:hypothetical protein
MTRLGGWGVPGAGSLDITTEKQLTWGYGSVNNLVVLANAIILGGTTDSTNTPTNVLRPGFLLGKITATGKYAQYVAANTDGTGVASAVLWPEILSQDFSATNSDRVCPVMVSGPVVAGQLIGLDNLARAQMSKAFLFDDDVVGNRLAPPLWVSKGANYTVLPADRGTVFQAITGAVTFTLPAILPGYWFKFVNTVAATMQVSSAEGTNMTVYNNASASSIAFSTAGQQIGAVVDVYTNPAGTKWIVEIPSRNAFTIA